MSTRIRVLLIALVWTCAAGLCVLYALCAPYRRFFAEFQWQFGVVTGTVLGWLGNDIIRRR